MTGAGGLNQTPTADYANNTNAGTATASCDLRGRRQPHRQQRLEELHDRQGAVDDDGDLPAGRVYNGSPHTPCTVTVTGAGGLNRRRAPTYTNNTNAGTATASYTFAGDANHTGSSDRRTSRSTGASVTTVTTAGGPTLHRLAAHALHGDGDRRGRPEPDADADLPNNMNAGTATASYTFAGDANHSGSSDSENFTSTRSSATWTTSPASKI